MVGKMLMVRQPPEEELGGFSHVLLDGRNFQTQQASELFTEQAASIAWKKTEGVFTYTDHEGGRVHRFDERKIAALPSAYAIRLSNNSQNAFTAGHLAGQQLAAMGIAMSLGPVVDIGPGAFPSRCFGTSAEEVIEYANLYIDGLKTSVLVCLKHWPGQDAVTGDSHHVLPHTADSAEVLENTHFKPFIALAEKTDAIMTAHIKLEAFDPIYPATFSKTLLSKLREKGFGGVILSDSLSMQGAEELFDGDLLLKCETAILAGCNFLMLGRTPLEKARSLQSELAIRASTNRELLQCICTSVDKIENMLSRYRAPVEEIHLPTINKQVRAFGKKIAQEAMRSRNINTPFVFKKVLLLTPELLRSNVAYGFERACKKPADGCLTWKNISPTPQEIQDLSESVEKDTAIIVTTFNADREGMQQQLVRQLFSRHLAQVCVLEANYSDLEAFMSWTPENMRAACTYSADSSSLKFALKALLQL